MKKQNLRLDKQTNLINIRAYLRYVHECLKIFNGFWLDVGEWEKKTQRKSEMRETVVSQLQINKEKCFICLLKSLNFFAIICKDSNNPLQNCCKNICFFKFKILKMKTIENLLYLQKFSKSFTKILAKQITKNPTETTCYFVTSVLYGPWEFFLIFWQCLLFHSFKLQISLT